MITLTMNYLSLETKEIKETKASEYLNIHQYYASLGSLNSKGRPLHTKMVYMPSDEALELSRKHAYEMYEEEMTNTKR